MSGFRQWLGEVGTYLASSALPGGSPPLGQSDLEYLRRSLRDRMGANERYLRVSFALAALLAIATLVATFWQRATAGTWMPAALGISTAGAVAMTMSAVRDKNMFDVMLELAVGLDDDAVRDVLAVLMKRQGGPAVPRRRVRGA